MAIRNLRYEGDEILSKRAREIDVIDDKIKELAQDMIETMHRWDGVGLAGPQVGVLKRIIVIDLYEEEMQFVLINPVLVKAKGVQEVDEGCLSFPNQFGKVERPKEVVVEALDLDGKKVDAIAPINDIIVLNFPGSGMAVNRDYKKELSDVSCSIDYYRKILELIEEANKE